MPGAPAQTQPHRVPKDRVCQDVPGAGHLAAPSWQADTFSEAPPSGCAWPGPMSLGRPQLFPTPNELAPECGEPQVLPPRCLAGEQSSLFAFPRLGGPKHLPPSQEHRQVAVGDLPRLPRLSGAEMGPGHMVWGRPLSTLRDGDIKQGIAGMQTNTARNLDPGDPRERVKTERV